MDCLSYLIEAFETGWRKELKEMSLTSALVLTPLCPDAQLALLKNKYCKEEMTIKQHLVVRSEELLLVELLARLGLRLRLGRLVLLLRLLDFDLYHLSQQK